MELIYVYIKKYENNNKLNNEIMKQNDKLHKNFIIQDIRLNFSDSFHCHFDIETGIRIEKTKPTLQNFYGESIKSFKVLVGRNGSGKTTILDILGMLRDERCDDHLIRESDKAYFTAEYFFIYHMKDDLFLLEIVANIMNEEECWIKNIDLATIFNESKNMHYKLPIGYTFEYSFKDNRIKAGFEHCFSDYKFDNLVDKKIADHANVYYFSNHFSHRKTNSARFKPRQTRDDEYLIKRQELRSGIYEPNDYSSLYKIMFSKKYQAFVKKMLDTSVLIQMTDSYSDDFLLDHILSSSNIKQEEKEKIETIKHGIRDFGKELFKNNGLPSKEKFIISSRKSKHEKNRGRDSTCKNSTKEKYLLELSCRYILNALNSLIELTYENRAEDDNYTKYSELTELEINDYINIIGSNEYRLCNRPLNEIKELDDFIKFSKIIWDNDEIARDTRLNIFAQRFFDKKNLSSFEKKLMNNIILGRYVLIRIESLLELGKDSMYQQSYEEILIQLAILNEKYFYKSGLIINSKIHSDDVEIIKLFETIDKWHRVESDYYNDIRSRFNFMIPYVSDGERCILDFFSKFINIIENEERTLHIILMDEPDQRLHPEWSRQFIHLMTGAIKTLNETNYKPIEKKLNVQFIISTHSPLLLSDVRKQDVILLDKSDQNSVYKELRIIQSNINTFAGNLYDILNKSFFLDDTIGEFAKTKIENECSRIFGYDKQDFLTKFSTKEITNDDIVRLQYFIEQISEPILQKALKHELEIRQQWLRAIDNKDELEMEVQIILEQYSKLDKEKKKMFIEKLIISERGDLND